MNQLILESCVHSWDPKQCLQKINMKGSCPMSVIGQEPFIFMFCKHCLGCQAFTRLSNINWFIMKA